MPEERLIVFGRRPDVMALQTAVVVDTGVIAQVWQGVRGGLRGTCGTVVGSHVFLQRSLLSAGCSSNVVTCQTNSPLCLDVSKRAYNPRRRSNSRAQSAAGLKEPNRGTIADRAALDRIEDGRLQGLVTCRLSQIGQGVFGGPRVPGQPLRTLRARQRGSAAEHHVPPLARTGTTATRSMPSGLFSRRSLYGSLPFDVALFGDIGAAWTKDTQRAFFDGDRDWASWGRRLGIGAFSVLTDQRARETERC